MIVRLNFSTKNIKKSFRNACNNLHIPVILFEGGKSLHTDKHITNVGLEGSKRFLHHLGMLNDTLEVKQVDNHPVFILESKWIRAKYSGMFKPLFNINAYVEKGEVLGYITDPFGKLNHAIKASNRGYLINVNESPIVYQGDAVFHITTKINCPEGDFRYTTIPVVVVEPLPQRFVTILTMFFLKLYPLFLKMFLLKLYPLLLTMFFLKLYPLFYTYQLYSI